MNEVLGRPPPPKDGPGPDRREILLTISGAWIMPASYHILCFGLDNSAIIACFQLTH